MTKQEAIDFIKSCKNYELGSKFYDAFDLAIAALENQIEIESKQFTHICQSDRELCPTTFSIYAIAKYNLDGTVTVDRYMKYGALPIGKITIPKESFYRYYKEIKND